MPATTQVTEWATVTALLGIVGLTLACGSSAPSSSSSPVTPTAVATPAPSPAPAVSVFSGVVRATNGGGLVAGVTVSFAGQSTLTDSSGAFMLNVPGAPTTSTVQIAGPSIVTRTTSFNLTAHTGIVVDVFRLDSSFDLSFYRILVRDGFEQPARLLTVRRWTQPPALYLMTMDDRGAPIDAATLDLTETTIVNWTPVWTGGRFGVASVTRGTGPAPLGTLAVQWAANAPATCGITFPVTGPIELHPNSGCGCAGARINARTIKHELGHAMGFYHTGDPQDLMSGIGSSACDQDPSPRERAHAADAYSRAPGNIDPDNDPSSVAFALPDRLMIID